MDAEVAFALCLVAVYVAMGIGTYRKRPAESNLAAPPFALRELGEALWVSAAWMWWPLGPPREKRLAAEDLEQEGSART